MSYQCVKNNTEIKSDDVTLKRRFRIDLLRAQDSILFKLNSGLLTFLILHIE